MQLYAGLDGRLQQATKLKGIRSFSARDNGLKPVHVEQLGPLWFFNLGKQRCGQALLAVHRPTGGMQHCP